MMALEKTLRDSNGRAGHHSSRYTGRADVKDARRKRRRAEDKAACKGE